MITILYPCDWRDIAFVVKELNDWTCQACGLQCRRPGEAFDGHKRTLTLAHITQDYEADAIFVACLCSRCHLLYDAPHSGIARRRNRRIRQRQAGQLDLLAISTI